MCCLIRQVDKWIRGGRGEGGGGIAGEVCMGWYVYGLRKEREEGFSGCSWSGKAQGEPLSMTATISVNSIA
jgi:hypothetical protein